jgi:biopolymer transport protein ExbD
MARLDGNETANPMFPFLSVLLCLIGVLILGILVLTVGRWSVELSEVNVSEMRAEHESYQQRIDRERLKKENLEAELQSLKEEHFDKSKLQSRLREPTAVKLRADKLEELIKEIRSDLEELKISVAAKIKTSDGLKDLLNQKSRKLEQLTQPGSVRIVGTARISKGEGISTISEEMILRAQKALSKAGFNPGPPDGSFGPKTRKAITKFQSVNGLTESGVLDEATQSALKIVSLHPVFIECRGDSAILHPSLIKIRGSKLRRSNHLSAVMTQVKKDEDDGAVIILLIRPDGVETYDQINSVLRDSNVRYGYVPIPGFSEIDLSTFNS